MTRESIQRKMNSPNISSLLKKVDLPKGLSEDALQGAIAEMAQKARSRLAVNNCGGLPGPLFAEESKLRKVIDFFEKK